jgi:hypothetical protein
MDHEATMVGTELLPNQGISHEALQEEYTEANKRSALKGVQRAGDLANYYKHVYVKEVVREDKMHFWKVPRLGAYMAVPLVYHSSLYESAF